MRIFTFFNIKRAKSEHSTFFFGICIEYNELRLIGHCQICVRRSLFFVIPEVVIGRTSNQTRQLLPKNKE